MESKAEKFYEQLQHAVETDQLMLPSLPKIALSIRDAVESDDSTAEQIAGLLSQDASFSARLVKVANSPLYRLGKPVDNIQTAVTRLGLGMVRDLVISLAMKQIFQATSDALDQHFHKIWNTAVDVSAICNMMATTVSGINPQQALLAGLVHNIGALPIIVMAENDDDLFNDAAALNDLINQLQGDIGELILQKWGFSDGLIEVVKHARDFEYLHDGKANLVDLVQVALIQGGFVEESDIPDTELGIPAFFRLDMTADVNIIEIEENQEKIQATKQSLLV